MQEEKIKRFIDCNVPVTTCNLRCHYCYITQQRKFSDALPVFKYTPEHMAKALSKERLGGICCLNLCGNGETLLPPEMTDIIRCFLEEGHYVMVVTNGTVSKRFDEIVQLPKELLERLLFKFSFQYLELKRLKMMEKFFDNIRKVREAGCSFSLELTPSDEVIPEIEEMKKICLEQVGALCHVTVARDNTKYELPILTNYSREEYKKIWSQFDSKMFEYKLSVFNQKRREFCYAGDWTCTLDLATGDLRQCYCGEVLQNVFEDIDSPIHFRPVGHKCPESHCYNAHAFLTFGAIPEHKAPFYAEMRNRVEKDGSEWLTPRMKAFLSTKLKESNKKYGGKFVMKSCIQSLFSVKNDGNHKVLRLVGLKLKFRKKEKNFGQKYKKELDEAISLLRDKESKKVFKSRVKFLSEPYEKKKTKIHKSSYEEYLNPNVLLKKGDVIIDAGVSEWVEPTLEFSNIVGDDGMVVGFEPEPVCFEEAVEQLREKKNIKLYNCGLWNKKDTFEIAQNGRGSSLFWKPEGVNVVECSLVKLDDFLKEENISKVDFIKMDIEGAEPEALEGCVETLRAQKPNLAICVYHKPEHLFEIILYLNSLNLGYKFELGHHRENEYSTVLYATVV